MLRTSRFRSHRMAALTGALAGAICVGGCGSTPTTPTTSPTPAVPACAPAVAADQVTKSVGLDAGSFAVAVTAVAGCAWSASAPTGFLQIASGATGTGNGSVQVTFTANTGAQRSGTLTVAGATVTVTQAAAPAPGCAFTLSATTLSARASGDTLTVNVTVTQGTSCPWTATTSDAFMTVSSGASGTGNGAVVFTVALNSGAARSGTMVIAGQTVTVSQAVGVACALSVTPTTFAVPVNGQSLTATVTLAQGTSCNWSSLATDPFITITSGQAGLGNGTVGFSVAANVGAARTGTLTIAGQTVTVAQAGVPVAVLFLKGDPGDGIIGDATQAFSVLSPAFTAIVDPTHNHVHVSLTVPGTLSPWTLDFAAPAGVSLAPGLFDDTARWPFQPASQPGMDVSGQSRGCNNSLGRFLVAEVVFDPLNSVQRLHAKFEQHCDYMSAAMTGEIWIDQAGSATVPGMAPLPALASPVTLLSIQGDSGDPVSGGQSVSYSIGTAVFRPTTVLTPRWARLYVNAPNNSFFWFLDIAAPVGQVLQPGTYVNAARAGSTTGPILDIEGNGRGCGTTSGNFQVLEVQFDTSGAILRFHATFEQHCDGAVPALRGEIYIVADPWR